MSNPLYTYDPSEITFTFGGFALTGFAEGSFITVEYDEDSFTLDVGTDGEGARNKNANRAGKFTVKLMQTSSSNDILSSFYRADRLSNSGIAPAMCKDNLGRSLHMAESAWVEKSPSADYAKESGVREWVIRTHHLEDFVGGTNG